MGTNDSRMRTQHTNVKEHMANKLGTGGSIQRTLVRRKLKRERNIYVHSRELGAILVINVLDDLIGWLDKQPKRLKRKGGLGVR